MSGDVARRTGGNLYDRRMERACRRAGVPLRIVSVRSTSHARAVLAREGARVVVVDSIAIPIVAPLLRWMRGKLRARVVVLMHMRTTARGTRALFRSADGFIAASESLRRMLVSAAVPRSRIHTIPPGCDRVPRVPRSTRRHGGTHVLTVANWSPSKGIATLVAAVNAVPNVHLDLVGDTGAGGYRDRVLARLRSRGLRERVVVHGTLRDAALARRYADADVFALATTREGYGTVFAEALAAGLPVVAADIPAARDVVGDAGLFVRPGRVRPLVAALRLMTDPWLRRRLTAAARSRARSLPRWAAAEDAFVALVKDELRATGARP